MRVAAASGVAYELPGLAGVLTQDLPQPGLDRGEAQPEIQQLAALKIAQLTPGELPDRSLQGVLGD